jgi:haloalkane dehalogenase
VGLRLVAARPERFDRVAIGNTGLPTGDATPSEAFMNWQKFSQGASEFPIGSIVNGGCVSDLSSDVVAAYDAPFPDDTFTAGARISSSLVPTRPDDPASDDNRAAWSVLEQFDRPFLLCFSDSDPVTTGGERIFRRRVPGTHGEPHTTVVGGGHFLQEDKGAELAAVLNSFIASG